MQKKISDLKLIAPCGMNCGICTAYLRDKNKCPGCRGDDPRKLPTRINCRIKNCESFSGGKIKYCHACEKFPCAALRHLDIRYRTKYKMSMIENLENIKIYGIKKFVESEKERWKCPECSSAICVHNGKCYSCGKTTGAK